MKRDDWTPEKLDELNKKIELLKLACGVDEVGRGPIAGPVVACAIIMPVQEKIEGVKDSKKLSEKKREKLSKEILDSAVAWGVGVVDERKIDEINILQATLLAMKTAVESMKDSSGNIVEPELVLVDAEHINIDYPQISVIKGDDRVYAISCASIVAKVYRDRIMIDYGKNYPEYLFEKHKGYGTKAHYEAIKKHGILPIHRRSFLHGEDLFEHGKAEFEKENNYNGDR